MKSIVLLLISASAWGADITAPQDAAPTQTGSTAAPRLNLQAAVEQAAADAAAPHPPVYRLGEAPRQGTLGRALVKGLRRGVALDEAGTTRLGLDSSHGRLTLQLSKEW